MKLFFPTLVASMVLLLSGGADALNVKMPGVNYNSRKGPDSAPDSSKCKTASEEKAKLAGLIDSGLYDDNVIGRSETIYREEINADTAISYMKEIRDYIRGRGKNTPVTIADVIDIYYANQQLIDAVDYVSVNQFSFWERSDINEGAAVILDRLKSLRVAAVNKGKSIVISEVGWSSGGSDPAAGVASPENQAKFFSDFFQMTRSHNFDYYWYVAFDSKWHVTNGGKEVEADFGIFQKDDTMKSNFQGLTIGWKDPRVLQNAGTKLMLSENGGNVYMSSKSSDWLVQEQQVWFFDSATQQVRSKSSDRCLDAYQPWNGGIVHVYRCIDNENNQKWTYDATNGQLKHATHQGFCLDQDPAQGNKLQLYGCSPSNPNQQWGVIDPNDISDNWAFSDGSVRFYTMESSKPFAQIVRSGDNVAIGFGGSNVDGSQWFYDPNTHLVKAKDSSMCLDAYQPWDGGIVHVYACSTNEVNQRWNLDSATNQLKHLTHAGFCLDADLSANNGAGRLQLWGCHLNNNNQVWRMIPASASAGTVYSSSTNDAYLQPTSKDTVVGASSTGTSEQHWFWDASSNRLISKINGQCLDAYEAWQGGRVHTYACIATEGNQKWSYDATNQMVKHAKQSGFCLAFDNLNNKLLQLKSCNAGDNTQRIRSEAT